MKISIVTPSYNQAADLYMAEVNSLLED